MSNQKIINEIIESLKGKKESFLTQVESDVYQHIRVKSTIECLTITTQKSSGSARIKWEPSLIPDEGFDYVRRLIPFLRKKNYNGQIVDSALTEGIIEVVINSFNKLYQSNNEIIAKKLVDAILINEKASNAFLDGVLSSKFSNVSKSYIKSAALGALKTQFASIAPVVRDSAAPVIAKATALAASTPIIKSIIAKLTIYIAAHLHVILAKLIAVPAIKIAIAALIKKFVIAAIVAAIVKFIVVKTGMSVGAIVAVVLVPIVVYLIVKEWNNFPENLARGIAEEIRKELRNEFVKTNETILSEILTYITGSYAKNLGILIMDEDPVFAKEIDKLIKIVGS